MFFYWILLLQSQRAILRGVNLFTSGLTTTSGVLTQIDQKTPSGVNILCWMVLWHTTISPPASTPSYNGDISPTSHASLTPQCLSPSSAAGGGPKRSRDMEKQWSREVQRYVEASSQIGSKRQINVVAVSLVGFDHPQHYFLLHIYSGQTLL